MLFIDEIHRLNPAVEEILYPAMEDFSARPHHRRGAGGAFGQDPIWHRARVSGATTRAGATDQSLRDRFGIPVRLNFYSEAELELIVNRGARVLGIGITPDGANEIARRARGTPRIAGRLLRRVRDFAHVDGNKAIDRGRRQRARRRWKSTMPGSTPWTGAISPPSRTNYGGGPVGVDTMAAALSEPRDAIEDIIEPFLIQKGFLQRTPRGRLLTACRLQASRLAPSRRAIRASSGCSGRRTSNRDPVGGGAPAITYADAL